MKKPSTSARRTVVGASLGVAVVGAAFGIAGIADAAPSSTPTAPSSGASAPAQPGEHGPEGRGHGRGPSDRGAGVAPQLAEKLGIDQAKVVTALQEVRQESRPTAKPSPGSAATPGSGAPRDRAADDAALAEALAPKLDVDEATITTALAEIRAERAAERAEALDAKLDAAVKAGTLTQAEADTVTKAVEKGVIAGGPR